MTKRKGESYLGGNTVISLHPKVVERNLAISAEEERIRKIRSQQLFDRFKERQEVRSIRARQELKKNIEEHAEKKMWESANSRRETPRDPNKPYDSTKVGYWKANLGVIRPWTGGEGQKAAWLRWRLARKAKKRVKIKEGN